MSLTPTRENSGEYFGEERRRNFELSEEQIERIADKVVERFYLNVGKAVVRAFLYIIGPTLVLGYLWIKGVFK